MNKRDDTILALARNPRLAHASLFSHRHPQETPPFHAEIIDLWHDEAVRQVLFMAFRGAAKSTLSEEAIVVGACLRRFKNGIILGESEPRAIERLTAIKHELETNSFIEELFGDMKGKVWQEKKIILSNGVIIQAFGKGQSLRGAKHLDTRPDMAFADDMESEENVVTPDARNKFKAWFMKVLIPAMAPGYRMRISGTPLDPESWLMKLKASRDWITKIYPIEYKNSKTGERRSTWPARFPLELIDKTKKAYEELGALDDYMQEYMCEASNPATRIFTNDMIRIEPVVRTWQPVYAMYDPARTVGAKSAMTGKAIWSWIGNRLVVWEAEGAYWKPDEIIADMFKVDETYRPIKIGVEQTGLHEFIMQPLRSEQLRRQTTIPVVSLNAPVQGQIGVIKGLQPWFKAHEVVFAKEFPELLKQMMAFPTGQRDILNALAYAPRMRPGQPVYDGFKTEHVIDDLELKSGETVFLCLNATSQYTTGQLCQFNNGVLYVTHDWMRETDPGTSLSDIVAGAGLASGRALRIVAQPSHFDNHDTVGLRPAANKVPCEIHRGASITVGRETLRGLLEKSKHGLPCVVVSTQARWTLNALAGGYCRAIGKTGLSEFTEPGPYTVLMQGLESLCGLLRSGSVEDDSERNYSYSPGGKRYLSSLAR